MHTMQHGGWTNQLKMVDTSTRESLDCLVLYVLVEPDPTNMRRPSRTHCSSIWPWVITYASILGRMNTHVPPI